MKAQTCLLLTLIILFCNCSSTKINTPDCEQMMCTQEFRMVQVKFMDTSGRPIVVKDFSAINKRTNKSTVQNNDPITIDNQGIYTVASDADLRQLSEAGDPITVNASHPITNKRVSAEFVVSGGKCACHINKVSGPEVITL